MFKQHLIDHVTNRYVCMYMEQNIAYIWSGWVLDEMWVAQWELWPLYSVYVYKEMW